MQECRTRFALRRYQTRKPEHASAPCDTGRDSTTKSRRKCPAGAPIWLFDDRSLAASILPYLRPVSTNSSQQDRDAMRLQQTPPVRRRN